VLNHSTPAARAGRRDAIEGASSGPSIDIQTPAKSRPGTGSGSFRAAVALELSAPILEK
jgi:hypothetical protein